MVLAAGNFRSSAGKMNSNNRNQQQASNNQPTQKTTTVALQLYHVMWDTLMWPLGERHCGGWGGPRRASGAHRPETLGHDARLSRHIGSWTSWTSTSHAWRATRWWVNSRLSRDDDP